MRIARRQARARFYRIEKTSSHPLGTAIIVLLLLCGLGVPRASRSEVLPPQGAQPQILLTEPEQAWVRAHPSIRVDNETDWPPFNFAEAGQPRGYSIDVMNLVAQRIGLQVDYVSGPPRSAFVPMLRRGELDVGLNIIRTPEREQDFLFTPPYVRIAPAILSRKEQRYSNLEQLAGKTIVIPNGFFYQEFVRRNFPQVKVLTAANTQGAIQAVARQEADAALGDRTVLSYVVGQDMALGLVISSELDLWDPELALARMATRKDNPILAGLLTKAIDSIGLEERRALERKWLGDQPAVAGQWARSQLSEADMVWLEQHPQIRLGINPVYPPFDFLDEKGVFSGASADYVDLVAKRLGVAMTAVPGLTWTEAVDGAKTGRVDVVVGIKSTEDRRQFLHFTPDYLTFPIVIMTRETHPVIGGLADLRGQTLALVEGWATNQEITARYPEIKQLLLPNWVEALMAVERGKADAIVLNLGTASYLMAKHSISGLVVAAPAGLDDAESAFGIRKDWPELAAIMRKALASITPQEEAAIRARWITTPYDARLATERAQRVAIQIAIAAVVVILAIVLWNYRLKRQVRERRRAEQIVAAKEAELRDMFERSPVSVVIVNPEGTVRYANSSWLTLFQISKDELTEFRTENLYADPAQRSELIKSAERSGSARDIEVIAKRGDGKPLHVLVSADLYKYEGETCFVSWFVDITERKKSEQALAEAERQLRDTANSVPGIVYQMRVSPDGRRIYTFMSDGVLELTGTTAEEALRDRDALRRLVFDEDKPSLDQAVGVAISTLTPITHDFRIRRPDGCVRWMQLRAVPRSEPDGAVVFNGYWVDATLQRETEEALARAKAAADAANEAKSSFLASMSHEIRTPMTGITGMVDILADTKLDADQQHMLRVIRESGFALITVINDILDFSKIESGKLELEATSMCVEDAVEGVATVMSPQAIKKNIRINCFIDPRIPRAVLGDPTRLRQILFNLLGNAAKFSEGRDIAVRAEPSDEGSNQSITRIRFSVIDRGIGIAPENQSRMFEAFSQAESSTTRRFGGTGLGLAICKRLAEMMGGAIDVESVLGQGSTFRVEIPFGKAAAMDGPDDSHVLDDLHISLVGGQEPRASALAAYLQASGATVSKIDGVDLARAASAMGQSVGRNIYLLDLGMSTSDQKSALSLLRDSSARADARIVVLHDFLRERAVTFGEGVVIADANPLLRRRLITAVARAAGRATEVAEAADDDPIETARAAPAIEDAVAQGQLILVAEDNPTNQDVIRRQLGMLGYACEIAGDGRKALEAYKTGRHAMLLTDCHMPQMDGYDLARAIRALEKGSTKRFPIIAITASVLQKEAEQCFAAGMDDYVRKPFTIRVLRDCLKKWLPSERSAATREEPQQGTAAGSHHSPSNGDAASPIDVEVIKEILGDDAETIRAVLNKFIDPSEEILEDLCAAAKARSAAGVERAAHKLKSSARTVGAAVLGDTCEGLEAAGDAADWAEVDTLLPQARVQLASVIEHIKARAS